MTRPGPSSVSAVFDPVLSRLQADAAVGGDRTALRLVPLAHQERPFSHVLRVGVYPSDGSTAQRHLFVKVFKPKPDDGGVEKMRRRVAHDFDVTRHVFEALTPWDGLDVVRPVACFVDDLAIVTEEADGETLSAYLDTHARWFPSAESLQRTHETMARIGQWLRAFQTIDATDQPIDLGVLRDYVDQRLVRLVAHAVVPDRERQRVLAHLDALAAVIDDDDARDVLVHADLAPGNILVSGRRIVVLDLAMLQRGSALHDITRLYLQLDVLRAKPQFRPTVIGGLQDALLGGYDPRLTPSRPLFRYLSMLHRINHLATLSLKKESLAARAVSLRVKRLHRAWIARELASGTAVASDTR